MNANEEIEILIVDDQINWQNALLDVLCPEGYKITVAASLSEAENYLESNEYRVVLADIRLVDEYPFGAQGLEVLRIAKKKGISAIILTGYTIPGLTDRAKDIGADYFMEKEDFDINTLRKIVSELAYK